MYDENLLYFVDGGYNRIRCVDLRDMNKVWTIAGSGRAGF
jgi:hypothetical protein